MFFLEATLSTPTKSLAYQKWGSSCLENEDWNKLVKHSKQLNGS
jgi:hypothetical protein